MREDLARSHGLAGGGAARDDHVEFVLDTEGEGVIDQTGGHDLAQLARFLEAQFFELAFLTEEKVEFDALERQAGEEPQADRHGPEHGGRGDDLRPDRAVLVGDRDRDNGAVLAQGGIGGRGDLVAKILHVRRGHLLVQHSHEMIALELAPAGAIRVDADLDNIVAGGGGDPVERGFEIAQRHGLRISPDRGRP